MLAGAIAMTVQALVIPRLDLRSEAEKAPKPYRLLRLDEAAQAEVRACLADGGEPAACYAQIGYEPPYTTVIHTGGL